MFEEPAPRQSLSLDLLGSRALPRLFLLPLLFLAACSLPPSKVQLTPSPASEGRVSQTGIASWYGPGFHGKATASGAIYDQNDLTAAHQTLPLGTRVMVTNLATGSSAEVTINDRGPFAKGRIIDLSYGAGKALGMIGPGTIPVRVEVLDSSQQHSIDSHFSRLHLAGGILLANRECATAARQAQKFLCGRFRRPAANKGCHVLSGSVGNLLQSQRRRRTGAPTFTGRIFGCHYGEVGGCS